MSLSFVAVVADRARKDKDKDRDNKKDASAPIANSDAMNHGDKAQNDGKDSKVVIPLDRKSSRKLARSRRDSMCTEDSDLTDIMV